MIIPRNSSDEVSGFLAALPHPVADLVRAVRSVVRATVPEAEESILWRSISYHRPDVGGRVKGAVCLISVKGDEVRVEFIHGVHLDDPEGMLRGSRLSKRFVPIHSVRDAERPALVKLIEAAAALDPADWTQRRH